MDTIKAEEIVKGLLKENDRRNAIIYAKFDPVTGEGSIGRRVKVHISDHPQPDQWLPVRMMRIPLVKQIVEAGSIERFLLDYMEVEEVTEEDFRKCWSNLPGCECGTTSPSGQPALCISNVKVEEQTAFSDSQDRSEGSSRNSKIQKPWKTYPYHPAEGTPVGRLNYIAAVHGMVAACTPCRSQLTHHRTPGYGFR